MACTPWTLLYPLSKFARKDTERFARMSPLYGTTFRDLPEIPQALCEVMTSRYDFRHNKECTDRGTCGVPNQAPCPIVL